MKIKNQTEVHFTHVGLVPTIACYGGCSGAWERLIQESLFSLITTGSTDHFLSVVTPLQLSSPVNYKPSPCIHK